MVSEGGLSSTIQLCINRLQLNIHSFNKHLWRAYYVRDQQPFHERESVLTRFTVKRERQANKQSDLVFEERPVNEVQGGE